MNLILQDTCVTFNGGTHSIVVSSINISLPSKTKYGKEGVISCNDRGKNIDGKTYNNQETKWQEK